MMRSPSGASAALLRTARIGRITLPATAPLCLEYEDVCSRPGHINAAKFSSADLPVFLDALIDLVEPVKVWFLWRPQLREGRHRPFAAGENIRRRRCSRTSASLVHDPDFGTSGT